MNITYLQKLSVNKVGIFSEIICGTLLSLMDAPLSSKTRYQVFLSMLMFQFKALRDSNLVSAQAPLKKNLNYKYSKVLLPSSKGSDIVGVMRQLMTQ